MSEPENNKIWSFFKQDLPSIKYYYKLDGLKETKFFFFRNVNVTELFIYKLLLLTHLIFL